MSNSLWPHGLQLTRLPYPSLSTRVCANSCPLSQWCHLTISSSVAPFSSCPQSFPASGSFPMSWLFASGGQSIGASVSASVLPMNIQDWLVWYPCHPILWHSAFFMVQFSHPYMTTGKTIALTTRTFVSKVTSPFFNMLSGLVIAFLARSKRL